MGGKNSDSIVIVENNVDWRLGDQEDNQIGLQRNATTITTTMTKEADDHDKEDPSLQGGENTLGGPRQGGGISVC
jgi:hypothetical protein